MQFFFCIKFIGNQLVNRDYNGKKLQTSWVVEALYVCYQTTASLKNCLNNQDRYVWVFHHSAGLAFKRVVSLMTCRCCLIDLIILWQIHESFLLNVSLLVNINRMRCSVQICLMLFFELSTFNRSLGETKQKRQLLSRHLNHGIGVLAWPCSRVSSSTWLPFKLRRNSIGFAGFKRT